MVHQSSCVRSEICRPAQRVVHWKHREARVACGSIRSLSRLGVFAAGLRAGLWCRDVVCSQATCEVAELLDIATALSAGTGSSCTWQDDITVLVVFGAGEPAARLQMRHHARLRKRPIVHRDGILEE